MADLVDLTALTMGTYISFNCKHPSDMTVYEGKIIGTGLSYQLAKILEGDLVPYHREVNKIITDLPPYAVLTYLSLEYQQSGQTLQVVRAIEWIEPSSVKLITPDLHFDIRVYNRDVGIDGQLVIDLLSSHGYLSGYLPKS